MLSDEHSKNSANLSLLTGTIATAIENIDLFQSEMIEILKILLIGRLLWRDLGMITFAFWGIVICKTDTNNNLYAINMLLVSNTLCFRYSNKPADIKKLAKVRHERQAATTSLLRNLMSFRLTGRLHMMIEQLQQLQEDETDALAVVNLSWAKWVLISK